MTSLTRFLLSAAFVVGAFAQQTGQLVSVSAFPPRSSPAIQAFTPSSTLQYFCFTNPIGPWAPAVPATFSWTRAASTLTSIVVLTNVGTVTTSTAHGLNPGNPIVISGATVDTDLNGTYVVATVPSTTTLTIATALVANNTYTESTLVATTSAPRTTVPIWAIQRLTLDASGNFDSSKWADGSSGSYIHICDNRATYTYR